MSFSRNVSPSSVSEGFSYLVVFITPFFNNLFEGNVWLLVEKCKLDMTCPRSVNSSVKWSTWYLSTCFIKFKHLWKAIFGNQTLHQISLSSLSSLHINHWLLTHPEIQSYRFSGFCKWTLEEEIGELIPDFQWDLIFELVHSSSICPWYSLLECKVPFRAGLDQKVALVFLASAAHHNNIKGKNNMIYKNFVLS